MSGKPGRMLLVRFWSCERQVSISIIPTTNQSTNISTIPYNKKPPKTQSSKNPFVFSKQFPVFSTFTTIASPLSVCYLQFCRSSSDLDLTCYFFPSPPLPPPLSVHHSTTTMKKPPIVPCHAVLPHKLTPARPTRTVPSFLGKGSKGTASPSFEPEVRME